MFTAITAALTLLLLASLVVKIYLEERMVTPPQTKAEEPEPGLEPEPEPEPEPELEPELDEPQLYALGGMTVTIYHAVPAQTDDSPMVTASGLDLEGHDFTELRVCALSRDLLARWGGPIEYGDQIFIDLPEKELAGWWTVEDTMAARWTNHIDLLVPTSRTGGKWTNIEALTLH